MKEDFTFKILNYSNNEINEVVNLIKKNLDNEFTEDIFKWKHLHNPFGRSFGLVATDNDKIVGLRLFMRWEFYNSKNGKIIKAIRPVDTVVHTKYQGRGLFKNLTMQGLELCEGSYDLVFNTPNLHSFPGYLKMGWIDSKVLGNFSIGFINVLGKGIDQQYLEEEFTENLFIHDFGIRTNLSSQYLNWRYGDKKYKKVVSGTNYIIFSKRKINLIPILFIYELIGDKCILQKMLVSLCRKTLIPLIYFYQTKNFPVDLLLTYPRKNGIIAFRNDRRNIKEEIDFSMGDLEGRL